MKTYISLCNYTAKGIENIKDSPNRLEQVKKLYASVGAKLKDFYLVTGAYDIVVIVEAPDDESVAKATMALGAKGNVRTNTFRAFTEAEYRKLIGALP
ncbi:MAG: GYD family protein [Verrucomicrobia bacterium RIFCSPLOWO2_12_FULL_64_8]|nr:MAG: GYD family protein [Verrucomicrobia bacterium RIFCSPLOWO2_12_FULL_64_8]